ncbi:hypothetical protein LWI28_008688 [Acer negundo]|uniref:Uncharacterized protein n=1 Tax=Acer negundo TaxID=4023 RepID=A0AAD5NZT8_ACENE|nr:hypothetical protein LWI28_008688 [Acer negundo]
MPVLVAPIPKSAVVQSSKQRLRDKKSEAEEAHGEANPNLTITDFNPFFILFNSVDYAHRSLFYRLYGLICFDYWFLRLKIGLAGY